METTTILYIVIGLIIVGFIGTVYYMSQKKKVEVVKEVSAAQVITVEACKLGYKLDGTECIFKGCPTVTTGSKPYYNDIENKECKLYTDQVWNAYNKDITDNPCKLYTLNPNANSYSSANKSNQTPCPLQDSCSRDAICNDGVCQQTRIVCGDGFTCRNGVCEFISGGKCPEGTYLKGTKADQSDWKCEMCNGLTSLDRTSCISPWTPSSDGTNNLTPNGCDLDNYYAKPLGEDRYQCTLRTNFDSKIIESLGCLQENAYQITSDTTTKNINQGLKCPNIDTKYNQDKCIIEGESKCNNGGCAIKKIDNSYYDGTDCVTCKTTSSILEVVNMQNNGCFDCTFPALDIDLFNRCLSRYTLEQISNAITQKFK